GDRDRLVRFLRGDDRGRIEHHRRPRHPHERPRGRLGVRALLMALMGTATLASAAPQQAPPPTATDAKVAVPIRTVLIKNATVWTEGPQGILGGADLLVRDGKVVSVGKGLQAPEGATVIDGTGKHVTPGLIDCHSHIAIR